jgi:hypothetical protein
MESVSYSNDGVGSGCDLPSFWKHDRHNTGRPWVGLNGTVVSIPHSEQVVRVSGRTRSDPRARLALHCLQCLGSFLNCLSWKNTCSPAVKTKSVPQSTHFSTRSLNSMAGFPHREIHRNRPWLSSYLPVPVPCRRSSCKTRARTALRIRAVIELCPKSRATCKHRALDARQSISCNPSVSTGFRHRAHRSSLTLREPMGRSGFDRQNAGELQYQSNVTARPSRSSIVCVAASVSLERKPPERPPRGGLKIRESPVSVFRHHA